MLNLYNYPLRSVSAKPSTFRSSSIYRWSESESNDLGARGIQSNYNYQNSVLGTQFGSFGMRKFTFSELGDYKGARK